VTTLQDWTAEDFGDSFQRHMPTGPVWPREPDTTQRAAVVALMPTYQRSWSVARDLPVEALPSTATFLLPEWEASLGLPDPCAGEDPTVALRQAHVIARLTQSLGPSIADLTAFAAALGYPVTIQEYAPARAGKLRAGQPCYGAAWAFAWLVIAPATEVFYFRAGSGRAGDPLSTFGSAVLQCEFKRIAPAHTIPMFGYTGSAPAGMWDEGVWDRDAWAT
jgi:uncharacterized protein YmfQ (DUF2313 family)